MKLYFSGSILQGPKHRKLVGIPGMPWSDLSAEPRQSTGQVFGALAVHARLPRHERGEGFGLHVPWQIILYDIILY